MNKAIFLILLFIFVSTSYSQKSETLYSLNAFLGLGYAYDYVPFEYEYGSLNRGGLQGYLRVMWKPEYLLSGGIEFGYTSVYSVEENNIQTTSGTTNLKTNVYAYPLMIVFSMPIINNWDINAGTGYAFSVVKNESFGQESFSSDPASTFMLSTAYYWPVMKNSNLGVELRWTALPKYSDYLIALSASFAYKFLEY